jgi:BolA protein
VTRVEKIEARLQQALNPERLELTDDSQSHAGHAGTKEHGGGHFFATVVSTAFEGKNLVQRHQLVCRALGDLTQLLEELRRRPDDRVSQREIEDVVYAVLRLESDPFFEHLPDPGALLHGGP